MNSSLTLSSKQYSLQVEYFLKILTIGKWTLFNTYNVSSLYIHITELQSSLIKVFNKIGSENTSIANSTKESILQTYNLVAITAKYLHI